MNKKKLFAIVASSLLITTITAGATFAYIFDKTGAVNNTFAPASVPPEIVEDFDGDVKNDVCIKNTGTVDAYIRAKVVVTWKNGNQVHATAPKDDTDYTIEFYNENDGISTNDDAWFFKDGFYYYKSDVAPQTSTEILFTKCALKEGVEPPASGYKLHVEIIAEAIQADGVEGTTPAVEKAWKNVEVASGKLQPKTSTQGQ